MLGGENRTKKATMTAHLGGNCVLHRPSSGLCARGYAVINDGLVIIVVALSCLGANPVCSGKGVNPTIRYAKVVKYTADGRYVGILHCNVQNCNMPIIKKWLSRPDRDKRPCGITALLPPVSPKFIGRGLGCGQRIYAYF